jgi:hypothetical protein
MTFIKAEAGIRSLRLSGDGVAQPKRVPRIHLAVLLASRAPD